MSRRAARSAGGPGSPVKAATRAATSGAHLPVAAHDVFEAGELLCAHRAARVELVGGDADLRAHAKLRSVGKLSGGIEKHDGALDPVEEALGRRRILGHDGVGMMRAVPVYVRDGGLDAID